MLEEKITKATEPFGIDVVTILAIIEAIMVMFEKCKPTGQRIKKLDVLDRARLRRELRRQFDAEDCCVPFRRRVGDIASALEEAVLGMSEGDCDKCIDEAQGV